MKNKLTILPVLLILLAGCTRPPANTNAPVEAPKVTSTGVVKVSVDPVELQPGGSADVNVRLKIDAGYHVNANPASDPYLKATELQLKPTESISINFLTYPNAQTRTFPFSEKPLAVYEGEAIIKVQLAGAKSAPKGTLNVAGKLNVQACDEQVCYAPGTIDVTIPVTVK